MHPNLVRQFEVILLERLNEIPLHIQVVLGPRQVGKTTGTLNVLNVLNKNFAASTYSYLLCESGLNDADWLQHAIQKELQTNKKIIVFDEIQKIKNWSDQIKLIWDKFKLKKQKVHIVLLGSSSLQLTQGLSESLAGRFEVIRVHHWNYAESQKFANLKLEKFIGLGGYPASYHFLKNEDRFRNYISESIVETVITKDIQKYSHIKNPALFRQTFALACQYPAQEVSYNKLLGQLQEAGNVDQIKHYLDLFQQAYLIKLIFKWSASNKSRTSSPKILPAAPVFTSFFLNRDLTSEEQGCVFEAQVGNILCQNFNRVYFWREGRFEVDYIVEYKTKLYAIEVKTKKRKTSGIAEFKKIKKLSLACYIDFDNYLAFEQNPKEFLIKFAL